MRAAEEPLRSDLNMTGLEAQVVGRIEELEAREREREEILAELIPAMEEREYDAGAVKAVMGARTRRLQDLTRMSVSLRLISSQPGIGL
jgi:hypothetical protein